MNKLHADKSLKERSKLLIEKRSKLVHEGYVLISQNDRNISKILADYALYSYISYMSIAESNQDFDYIISNLGKTDKELIKQIEILEELLSHDAKMNIAHHNEDRS